jgi:hypothetical protein
MDKKVTVTPHHSGTPLTEGNEKVADESICIAEFKSLIDSEF